MSAARAIVAQVRELAGLCSTMPRDTLTPEGMELARDLGSIEERRSKGATSYRIEVNHAGRRYRITGIPVGRSHWLPFRTREAAQDVLQALRSEVGKAKPPDLDRAVERAVSHYLRVPTPENEVLARMGTFLARERGRMEAGDVSPRTVRELERMLLPGGLFAYWNGWHVFAITYGALEDWRAWLAHTGRESEQGPRSGKTIQNTMAELRRCLRWLHRRGDLDSVPDFPRVPTDRKAPAVLRIEEQQRVLAAIPWRDRGLFLAMAHSLRPGEARAMDLFHWNEPDMLVQTAIKGPEATAPIRSAKERNWRIVAADEELVAWVCWRLEQATRAERLQRRGVALFPNWRARTEGQRWSHWALWSAWRLASTRAGVRRVPVYAATKHTMATELVRRGVDAKTLQRFLGHADARSTDAYVVLGSEDVKNTRRRL